MKWLKKECFKYVTLIISILFFITLSLFVVTRPALLGWFVLDNDAYIIGSAIGGIGTVIVGIANVIMLYLTFKNQSSVNKQQQRQIIEQKNALIEQRIWFENLNTKLSEEEKDRIAEKEYSQFLGLRNQFENIKQFWFSKSNTISQNIIQFKKNNKVDTTVVAELVLIYNDLYHYLCAIKKGPKKQYKQLLLDQAKLLYNSSMNSVYLDICAIEDNVDWKKINVQIEKCLT